MSKKYTRVLKLEGLDCASCADKIETSISKLDYIQEATVNFVMKTLTIEFKENVNIDKLMDNIKDTIIKIEPHVEVTEETKGGHSHSHDHGHGHDHGDMDKKKVITKLTIGVILFIIPNVLEVSSNVEFGLYLASYLIIGYDIVWQAIKNIGRRQIFDEYFLMTVATVGAFAIGQYAEGVAVMLFYQVGELFQDIAVNRSRDSITALMDIRPDFANLKVKDETVKVSPEEVKIGDIILIKPGEKVPLDGIVIKGQSSMDTSALTGESLPREIGKGDEALSGFINQTGVLEIEVTKEFGESTVTKILELVENASNRKAKTENFITKFARSYTPMVVGAAALIAIVPPLLISDATFGQYIYIGPLYS